MHVPIKQLQMQLDSMQKQLERQKYIREINLNEKAKAPKEFTADVKELAREAEWIRANERTKTNKKRKINTRFDTPT